MKILFVLLLLAGAGILPFVVLKRPWAVKLWRHFRLVLVIYILVVVASAILRLVFNWDDIYG